jgi:hypothetical protein
MEATINRRKVRCSQSIRIADKDWGYTHRLRTAPRVEQSNMQVLVSDKHLVRQIWCGEKGCVSVSWLSRVTGVVSAYCMVGKVVPCQ